MQIKIDDDFMYLEIDGKVLEVSYWPRFFDRNQAITALTITELLESGHDSNDQAVLALREELR
jgi:hypothetical protein